ncbi:MAG: type II toxin-antitoxin system VapB family antitoxin [Solirubrobacteraceae bacterium]
MRTTINVDDGLLAEAKRRAAERGTTLTKLIEDALRTTLSQRDEPNEERFETITFRGGGLMPGVDLDDNAALRDLLDGE